MNTSLVTRAAALLLGVALAFNATADGKGKAPDPQGWGVYATLVGTAWDAPGGYPRKAWMWSEDGRTIIELVQDRAKGKAQVTHIKQAAKDKRGDKLVATTGELPPRKGEVQADGSVEWAAEFAPGDKGEGKMKVALEKGVLVETPITKGDRGGKGGSKNAPVRYARAKDTTWVAQALDKKGKKFDEVEVPSAVKPVPTKSTKPAKPAPR